MKFKLTINCDNAAFEEDRAHEVGNILTIVCKNVRDGAAAGAIFDANGNRVGNFIFADAD